MLAHRSIGYETSCSTGMLYESKLDDWYIICCVATRICDHSIMDPGLWPYAYNFNLFSQRPLIGPAKSHVVLSFGWERMRRMGQVGHPKLIRQVETNGEREKELDRYAI